jgi:GT2 family glycosyltransferase
MQQAAIVILNFNGEKMLRKFLPGVCAFSKFPVVVIDNGSTDGSIAYLQTMHPNVRLIILAQNSGFTGGYNRGLAELEGEFKYYILLNSDVEVGPHWDEPMIQVLESNPKIASVQPKILSFQDPSHFDYAGAGGGFVDSLGYPYCRGRIFQDIEHDLAQYDDSVMVDWTSGACMAVRASLYHSLGGFDERFFAHMEEIDICWRWRRAGYICMYVGAVYVLHVGGATLSRTSPRKTFLNFRNNLWMLGKNLPLAKFIPIYICRLSLDALAALVFLVRGSIADAVAVAKAHFAFLFSRSQGQNGDLPKDQPISVAGRVSILFDYYIRSKKKYGDI